MSWDQAACHGEDPREWDDYGTPHAWAVCRRCPIRRECVADAKASGTRGVMRGNLVFADFGKPRDQQPKTKVKRPERPPADWDAWKRMRDGGMSLPQIGRAVGRHHTTILSALRRLEAE